MENKNIAVLRMPGLTEAEVCQLFALTNESKPGRRSIFRGWLNSYKHQQGIYVALHRSGEEIIAWAAVANHHGMDSGLLGVFVRADKRGQGLAGRMLDALLSQLHTVCPDPPEIIEYNRGLERVFRPSILNNGFQDCYLCADSSDTL